MRPIRRDRSADALTRRDLVVAGGRAAGLLLASTTVASALASCGGEPERGPQAEKIARTSIAIDLASYYAPVPDLKRLALARAAKVGAAVRFTDDPQGSPEQVRSLKTLTGERGGYQVVAVAPFDTAPIEPLVASARERGVDIVSFLTPLRGETAGITVDQVGAARTLVEHAATQTRTFSRVLLIVPPATSPIPDPFHAYARANADALTDALAHEGAREVVTVEAVAQADAEPIVRKALSQGSFDAVLAATDVTALGAIQALGARDVYVGALGAPSITSSATLDALNDDGPLRCVVAPRLGDLANALVDVPWGLLQRRPTSAAPVAVRRLTSGSSAARIASSDYDS